MSSYYRRWIQSFSCLLLIGSYVRGHKINEDLAPASELLTDKHFSEHTAPGAVSTSRTHNNGKTEALCILKVADESLALFTHVAHYRDLAFVYLRLKPRAGLHLDGLANAVYPDLWIWTYRGNKGGFEFLTWPMDFGIWSLGILYSYVDGPFDIEIYNVSGDCAGLKVGNTLTDFALSRALVNLTTTLIETYGGDALDRYGTSYFCHKRKIWIEQDFIYDLCRNMICPIEALEHVCHSFAFRTKLLTHNDRRFNYNDLWWIGPMFIAMLLVSVCPLVILNLTIKWIDYFDTSMCKPDNLVHLDGSSHITVAKVLMCPLLKQKFCSFRIVRCVLPFISLSFVGVQVLLDYRYLYDLVLKAVDKDIHMGFRSMLAGYSASCGNYLPVFGGPFVACSLYIFMFCILLFTPNQIENALETGLTEDRDLTNVSPLYLNILIQERYGSVILRNKIGYKKVYNALLANINMCLNLDFWKFLISLQRDRWRNVHRSVSVPLSLLLFPFFISICVLELLTCVLIYGSPLVSFFIIIFRAYRLGFRQHITCRITKPVIWVTEAFLCLCIAFFFFMFCIIFLDACRFISRVCIFTFTGVVVYPTRAYGYLIFIFTVLYYFLECLNNFASHYNKILRLTTDACQSVQKENPTEKLVQIKFHCKGISAKLFMDVINAYSPIRTRILISFLWFALTVYILEMSVHLITQRDELHDLHTIMHVVTVVFLCSFPKLIKSIWYSGDPNYNRRKELQELKTIVKRNLGYFSDEEISVQF